MHSLVRKRKTSRRSSWAQRRAQGWSEMAWRYGDRRLSFRPERRKEEERGSWVASAYLYGHCGRRCSWRSRMAAGTWLSSARWHSPVRPVAKTKTSIPSSCLSPVKRHGLVLGCCLSWAWTAAGLVVDRGAGLHHGLLVGYTARYVQVILFSLFCFSFIVFYFVNLNTVLNLICFQNFLAGFLLCQFN